jgi:hypothetical protein
MKIPNLIFMLSAGYLVDRAGKISQGLATLSVASWLPCEQAEQRVGELPGIHGKHGAKYLLDAHGEVVGNGDCGATHYLDNQGRQRRSLNNRRALQTRFELCVPRKPNCAALSCR